jgi:gliding motility-associated-like protein
LLSGDCDPVNSSEAELTVVVAPNVINELENAEVCEKVEIEVPYNISNFLQIIDLELTLHFDNSMLNFIGLTEVNTELEFEIEASANGNEIVVGWNSDQPVTIADGTAFFFEFESLTSGSSELQWQESKCSITNAFGYSPSLEFTNSTILVNPLAIPPDVVYADPDSLSIMENIEVELSADGGQGDQLVWFAESCEGDIIGDGNPLSIPRPETTTEYFARWENGCGPTSCQKVTVFISHEYDVYTPNAFSPNNDGLNDKFELISPTDLVEFYLQVYDRWGQLLYETSDLYDGWDGTKNGKLSPPGTYVWKASYRLRKEGPGSDSRTKSGIVVLLN